MVVPLSLFQSHNHILRMLETWRPTVMEGTKLHFYMTGQDRERNVSRTDISAGHQHQPSPLRSAKLTRIDHLKLLLFGNFLSQAKIY